MESQGNTCNAVQIILLIIFFKLSCSYEIRRKHVCTFKQNHILETNAHFGQCAALIIRINSKVIWSFLAFFSLSLSHTQNDILGTKAFRKLMKRTNMKRRTLHNFFSLTENAMNEWMMRQTKQQKKNIDRSTHLLFVDVVVVAANVQVHTEKCSQSVLRQSRVLSTKPYVLGKLFFWRGRKKQSKNNTRIML